MKREIITTDDGSKTIHIPEWNEQYHSKHGAIQEANHVYIGAGLEAFLNTEDQLTLHKKVNILEIGFGTGLNAFLSFLYAERHQIEINYVAVEAYPISQEELQALNYSELLQTENNKGIFKNIHDTQWEKHYTISECFHLKKQQRLFSEIQDISTYNVIFFDAFGPRVQPELWTEAIFKIMFAALKPRGVLVTYCAQGNARRAMISAGFKVEKIQGPPGKRHMLRATKA